MSVAMSVAAVETPPTRIVSGPQISWAHPPGGFLGLSLLNGLLRILTLGVYHFWGKTEVRQRIWSAVRINGEPLDYRGTGGELFRGFLIVFFLILLPLAIAGFAAALYLRAGTASRGVYELGFWVLILSLSGIGIHRARRYRLSRTRWRGIRGGLTGSSTGFAWTYLWTLALVPVTLGWILPWRAVRLQKVLFDQTKFGDKTFTFTGRAGPLYRRFWIVWLSAIVLAVGALAAILAIIGVDMSQGAPKPQRLNGTTIAMCAGRGVPGTPRLRHVRAWYTTRVLNYFASETQLHGTRSR